MKVTIELDLKKEEDLRIFNSLKADEHSVVLSYQEFNALGEIASLLKHACTYSDVAPQYCHARDRLSKIITDRGRVVPPYSEDRNIRTFRD